MTEEPKGFEEPDVPSDAERSGGAKGAKGRRDGKDGAPAGQAGAAGGDAGKAGGPASAGNAGHPGGSDTSDKEITALRAQLDQVRTALGERTGDLQRLQAEYQNYRRRVERDRIAVKEIAIANLLTELLPVLDDIGRARDHGELVGGFKSVAESLETVAAKLGLQQFGKEGEPFDPLVHEALMHSYSPDVTQTTCVQILQPGYRIGERNLRPARVAVAEPQPGSHAKGGSSKEGGHGTEDSGAGQDQDAPDTEDDGGADREG